MKTLLRIRTCVEWTLHMFRMAIFLLNEPFGASFIFHLSFFFHFIGQVFFHNDTGRTIYFVFLHITFVLQLFQHFL